MTEEYMLFISTNGKLPNGILMNDKTLKAFSEANNNALVVPSSVELEPVKAKFMDCKVYATADAREDEFAFFVQIPKPL